MRKRHIVICGLSGSTVFFHIISKAKIFQEKHILSTERVLWFPLQILSETFLILRRSEQDMIKNAYCLHVKYPLLLSDFNDTWIFSTYFRKIIQYQISWKSVMWEPSCSTWIGGQTQTTKRIVHFRNFANAPKNWTVNICFIMLILISLTFNRKQANKNEPKETKLIGIIISYTLGFVFRDLIVVV
jgi:hypothetical protein